MEVAASTGLLEEMKIFCHQTVERTASFSCHQEIGDRFVKVSELARHAPVEWMVSSKALYLADEALVADPEDPVGLHEYPHQERMARHPATLSFSYPPCRVIQVGMPRSSRMGRLLELDLVILSEKVAEMSSWKEASPP
jgi:hypothetical protein